MLEKSFALWFYLKQNKEETFKFVYLRISVDTAKAELSTKMKWDETRWDQKKGRATGTKEDARTLNAYLEEIALKVQKARRSLLEDDEEITATALRDHLTGKSSRKMIMLIFAEHNRNMAALVPQDYAPGTLTRYQTSYQHTLEFLRTTYQTDDMDVRKLDLQFIQRYAVWLKTKHKCNHNTTMKYLSNFKKIVLFALHSGWIQGDPFAHFKLSKNPVLRNPLTEEQVRAIIEKDFGSDRVNYVRDIFVFCCFTGLAYADVKKLRRSEISTGVDGEQWIITARQKTPRMQAQGPCAIPLLPVALRLLEQYKDHPLCAAKGLALPVLSNQKMNAYLKEIAFISGVPVQLTFHVARHTFATTALSNGVPMETVAKILGHANLKQTQHYAKILHTKISQDVAVLRAKFSGAAEKPVIKPNVQYNYIISRT